MVMGTRWGRWRGRIRSRERRSNRGNTVGGNWVGGSERITEKVEKGTGRKTVMGTWGKVLRGHQWKGKPAEGSGGKRVRGS